MCPYCGSALFVSATTRRRSEGTLQNPNDLASTRLNQTWVNECAACHQWSLHQDSDHAQMALVDPADPEAAVA